ncbi:Putative RxLR effector [Phytophthora palmivora]|uniref:RxLR effector n=1 Tax=Phytophthora palmivora TaxID=4796 RepID=A0A2P4WY53_9STRA|nr:Putative RxLR effector [Phytophthora palmivora]
MSHHYVVLLAVFVILANVHVSCTSAISLILPTSFAKDQDNFTSRRFLRTGYDVSKESEDKFPEIPKSIIEKTYR